MLKFQAVAENTAKKPLGLSYLPSPCVTVIQSCPWVGSIHGLGWIGLGRDFFYFWWVGSGRGSETTEVPKLKILTVSEFIDTDGHGFGWVVGWVRSLVQIFIMVWVGSKTLDPRTTVV